MESQDLQAQPSWWKLILTGLLAFAFGLAAIFLPADIMFRRIPDVTFGEAKPLSGSMTAVAALLVVLALVAFGTSVTDKRVTRLRGVVGVGVAIVAIF
jgi:hypothetical protein